MKIGAVSDETGLGIHTIRYYEKQGLIKKPEKDASGHRAYDSRDIEILNWVSCMKNSGMSLNKIKLYTKAFYDENPDKLEATYGRLIPVLVKAIQELRQEIRDCKNCKNN